MLMLRPLDRVNVVLEAAPFDDLPDFHAIAFGDALGGDILGADKGDQAIGVQCFESPLPAGSRRFGSQAFSPMVEAQVISNLVK